MTFGDFLSRLCGGECVNVRVMTFGDFLSRLCGGELRFASFL